MRWECVIFAGVRKWGESEANLYMVLRCDKVDVETNVRVKEKMPCSRCTRITMTCDG